MKLAAVDTRLEKYGPLVGRVLLSIIFILSGISKIGGWSKTEHMMSTHHIPAAPAFLAVAVAIEILCGLAILFGFKARWASLLLFFYLIPVSVIMHAFWHGPAVQAQMQQIMFLKNLAIMGGLLLLAAYGPGRYSADAKNKWALQPFMRHLTHTG